MKVHRYRPAYFSGFDDEDAEVDTLEELLAVPWVHSWTQHPQFYRFSVSHPHLMAELDEGHRWVVATFTGDTGDGFGLPVWAGDV